MADVKINTQTHQFDRVYHIPKEQLANALRAIPHNGADDYVFRVEDQYYIASRRGDKIPLTGEGIVRFRTSSHDQETSDTTSVTVDSLLADAQRADGVVKYQGKTGFMVAVDDEVNTKKEGRAEVSSVLLIPQTAGGALVGMFTAAGALRLAEKVLNKASFSTTTGIAVGVGVATAAAIGILPTVIGKHLEGKKAEAKTVDLDMLAPFASQIDN